MFYAYLEKTCTYGGQLSHECPSTMIVLLDIYVHSTTKNKVSMFAIFIRCKKKQLKQFPEPICSSLEAFYWNCPEEVMRLTLLDAFLYKIKGYDNDNTFSLIGNGDKKYSGKV